MKRVRDMAEHSSQWNRVLDHENTYKDVHEKKHIFLLLNELKISIQEVADDTHSAALATDLIDLLSKLKADLLGHEINIILAAFLMNTTKTASRNPPTMSTLFDFGREPCGCDMSSKRTRTPASFIANFPYDYLACIYKISVDCYLLRKVNVQPNHFQTAPMQMFHLRAQLDIKNVSFLYCVCSL